MEWRDVVGYGEVGVRALEVEGYEGYEGYGVYASGYVGFAICVWGM